MKASLDTNAIIHFYRANLQNILFDFFNDGVIIYEQIRNVELAHHAGNLLNTIDADINSGKIIVYTNKELKNMGIYKIFEINVKENRLLYSAGDLGEVYAISLAQTLGMYSLVTDDTKNGGPYISLLQFEDEVMPFTFADVLILRYLMNMASSDKTIQDFESINSSSNLNWSFKSQIIKFIKRFLKNPYREDDKIWIKQLASDYKINIKSKLSELRNKL